MGRMKPLSPAPQCSTCGDQFAPGRYAIGYRTCLACGETSSKTVKRCVVPLHKSAYVLITDPALLTGINNKQPR